VLRREERMLATSSMTRKFISWKFTCRSSEAADWGRKTSFVFWELMAGIGFFETDSKSYLEYYTCGTDNSIICMENGAILETESVAYI
jgi:hypothetical protein